jgi:AraC-like DNA-binding protein
VPQSVARADVTMQLTSIVANFDDPQPFQSAIRAGEFEILPTARGDFRSELIKIDLGSVWMQHARESLPVIHKGALSTDRVIIVFRPESERGSFRFCGLDVKSDDIVLNGSDTIRATTEAPSGWASMSLDPATFAAAAEAITGREILRPSVSQLMRPAPDVLRRLRAVHHAAGELAKTDSALLAQQDVVCAFETQLTEMMVRSLGQGEPVRLMTANLRQRTIIARFEEFMEMRREQPVYLIEICKALGVSERTLRSACQEQFGLSPTRYLWLRRMYLARRRLFQAAAKSTSVTEVAMANGFWELGRFATEYRSLFGETPSMTLRRAS